MRQDLESDLVEDATITTRIDRHGQGCGCALHGRRLFTGLLAGAAATAALPVLAREGVEVGGNSKFTKLVSAEEIEAAAQQQYLQLRQEASGKGALAPAGHPQQQRLQFIADRLIPHTLEWNARAKGWKWEVSLIGSKELNAFCMPGGKIAFYLGILQTLQLTDEEVAMIMGHEMAHALREHARERIGKQTATRVGANLLSSLLGLGGLGDAALGLGSQLLTLKFGRQDESEADLVGMELAARAGYNPRAGVTLWQKMAEASKGAPPQFLSTHPSSSTRIQEIEASLPKVTPLFARAARPPRQFGPPALRGNGG
ncbi:M48 family metallopeptidase [Sphaerotilus sp.]|uniref:M48 family metallopeptidase n=1 Tax=Sphaerotilus sp. TaxID=2093942 RepID=UPI002ACD84A4|nr:M48 family metallopeptidase [Sphaerotilus sp.]MDZ7857367.1 M48 family metallopeptidase [Sphaerotilus sp.]